MGGVSSLGVKLALVYSQGGGNGRETVKRLAWQVEDPCELSLIFELYFSYRVDDVGGAVRKARNVFEFCHSGENKDRLHA